MTYKTGFLMGIVLGAIFAYGALGFGGATVDQEVAQNIIIGFGVLGFVSTAYSVWKRESLWNSTFAGLITGVGWSATGIAWLLFGLNYP